MKLSQDSLRTLSEETGGFAAVNQNTLGIGIRPHRRREQPVLRARLLSADTRARRPVPQNRSAREAARAARLGAPGICLTARPHACRAHAARRKRAGRATRSEAPRTTRRQELRDALNAPLQQSGLTFSMQAAPFRLNAEGGLGRAGHRARRRAAGVRARDRRRAVREQPRAVVFRHQPGRPRAAGDALGTEPRRCGPSRTSGSRAGGLRVNPRMTLEAGRYQIRVGVRDSDAGRSERCSTIS